MDVNDRAINLPDGIYFGLPDEQYHALPRLSASYIKLLRVSPLRFWMESWMNPRRKPDADSPAKKLGRAYHKLILEGDEAFERSYAVMPSKVDYPDAVDGAESLRALCGELGLKRSGKISDLCERIRDADPSVVLWPDIMAEFQQEAADRERLTREQWEEIECVRYVLHHMPEIKDAFTCGYPEVSILYTDKATRVPMKARMDYLKVRNACAAVLDLKTFGNVMDKPIDEIPETEITRNDYFIQPPAYSDALKAARVMWSKKVTQAVTVISGDNPSEAWLEAVFSSKETQFHFVFVQTGGIPDITAVEFAEGTRFQGLGWQSFQYWMRGQGNYRYGINLFKRCMDQYGEDVQWVTHRSVRTLVDEGFPVYALSQPIPLIEDEAA